MASPRKERVMSQERWSFWKKREEDYAGGDSLERSESESPPASPLIGVGTGESCQMSDDTVEDDEEAVVDLRPDDVQVGDFDESPSSAMPTPVVDPPPKVVSACGCNLRYRRSHKQTLIGPRRICLKCQVSNSPTKTFRWMKK